MRRYVAVMFMICLSAMQAQAREQIRAVGSSTVYPFAASVAEHMGMEGEYRTPVVEATGTGAGFKLFCAGVGEAFPDISDASRAILPSEREACEAGGVHRVIEVKFGYDGITLANAAQSPHFALSKKQIFLALAREVPDGKGGWKANPYQQWNQIDPMFPDFPIKVYGTPPVSGTRDTFVELVMEKGCLQVADASQFKDKMEEKQKCHSIREDGAFVEAGENGNLIAQKLITDPKSLGIFGFTFLDQNPGRIQGSTIDGVMPTFETIQSGAYSVSRPLFIYIKGEHLALVPGLADYVHEFTSETAIGDEGYLVMEGLVPLTPAERSAMRASVNAQMH